MSGYVTGEIVARCINCNRSHIQTMIIRVGNGYVCADCHIIAMKELGKMAVIEEYHRILEKERKENGS